MLIVGSSDQKLYYHKALQVILLNFNHSVHLFYSICLYYITYEDIIIPSTVLNIVCRLCYHCRLHGRWFERRLSSIKKAPDRSFLKQLITTCVVVFKDRRPYVVVLYTTTRGQWWTW